MHDFGVGIGIGIGIDILHIFLLYSAWEWIDSYLLKYNW